MSLQVWLPLTKDLRNQGLTDVTVTNNGATFNSAGKLGGCYSFDGIDDRISCSSYTWTYPMSISAWFKPTDVTNTNTQYWLSYNTASGGTNGHAIAIGLYGAKLSIWYGGQVRSLSTTIANNIWYHIVVTIDANKKVITYLNGTQIDTITFGSNNPGSTWLTLGARSNSNTGGVGGALYFYKGYMNDARLYDHCLSPMEVKQISQGLVLHYPLNRQGWGQENLLSRYVVPGMAAPTSTAAGGRTTWLGDYKITIPAIENADTYFRLFTTKQLTANATYTISCKVSGLLNGTYYNFPLYAQNNASMGVLQLNHNGLCSLTFTMTYGTQTAATGASGETVYICFMDDSTRSIASGQGAITVSDFKLEEGSIVTPWCPNSSDALATTIGLNSTTEYDCSGFGNNGTRIGTLNWSSDTPKYEVSTYFEDYTRTLQTPLSLTTPTAITLAIWIKSSNKSPRGGYHMPLNIDGGYYEFSLPSNGTDFRQGFYVNSSRVVGNYSKSGTTLLDGNWHHLCATFDGTNIKRYIDGTLINTTAASGTLTTSNKLYIGVYGTATTYGNTQIYESDCRIYATALSASDVQSLYQNSAYIDSNGNVYGAVHSEV